MAGAPLSDLAGVQRWLRESRAGAERLLPTLLGLPAPQLGAELERHLESRPGVIPLLLNAAHDLSDRDPWRAHELTSVAVQYADVQVPPPLALVARDLKGNAWIGHASAQRGIGRPAAAMRTIAKALALFREGLGSAWHIATAEVVEARILHDQGQRDEALRRIRHAAAAILLHGDRERYVQTRMTESWMHWDAGNQPAAAEVWRQTAEEASQRGDTVLLAQLDTRIGLFHLHHGTPDRAAHHLTAARDAFEAAGLPREATRTRRHLAETAAARGRYHEAISEYYKVHALLLANGDILPAAVAAAEILELLLIASRDREVLPLAERLVPTFTEAGLQLHALQAWTFVRGRARTGELTRDDLDTVRRYFEDLPLQPHARFITTPEHRAPKPAVPTPGYLRTRAALGDDPQTQHAATTLESQAATHAYASPPVPGTIVRILRGASLRLYYSVDEEAVRLLWIERYGDDAVDHPPTVI
jgi:tetratricopeptide (TPR) repeat protein